MWRVALCIGTVREPAHRVMPVVRATVRAMRHGLFVPVFDELSEPALVARLAAEAEAAGWDGVFVWEHVCLPRARPRGRRPVAGNDVAVGGPRGTDGGGYEAAGATWWMTAFPVATTEADVRAVLRDGPPRARTAEQEDA